MRLRRVIWNPWQSNGKLRNIKSRSFEVLCHKKIQNTRSIGIPSGCRHFIPGCRHFHPDVRRHFHPNVRRHLYPTAAICNRMCAAICTRMRAAFAPGCAPPFAPGCRALPPGCSRPEFWRRMGEEGVSTSPIGYIRILWSFSTCATDILRYYFA